MPGIVVLKRYAAFPQVVAVIEKSPAEAAGVKLGDLLSAIGGRNTLSMSLTEVKLLLSGTDEQPVDIRVLRGNDTHNLERAARPASSRRRSRSPGPPASRPACASTVSTHGLVAGIRRDVVPALKARKSPLVLDLRDCQDGTIDEAKKLVNLFVKAADAGRFEGRGGAKETVSCPAEAELGAVPARRLDRRRDGRSGRVRRGHPPGGAQGQGRRLRHARPCRAHDALPAQGRQRGPADLGRLSPCPPAASSGKTASFRTRPSRSTSSTRRPTSRKLSLFCPSSDG